MSLDEQRKAFEAYYIANHHDGDIHPNQQLLEWSENGEFYFASSVNDLWDMWYAGAQSRQAEIDKLNQKIAMYEKHVKAIRYIHENQFNENTDASWILGNLDGFFECLESDLKGK